MKSAISAERQYKKGCLKAGEKVSHLNSAEPGLNLSVSYFSILVKARGQYCKIFSILSQTKIKCVCMCVCVSCGIVNATASWLSEFVIAKVVNFPLKPDLYGLILYYARKIKQIVCICISSKSRLQ